MAVDYFLKIEGIKGESEDIAHRDWIEVESWSWGLSQPGIRMAVGVGAGSGAGRAAFKPLSIQKRLDKSSPALFRNCASARRLPSAILELVERSTESGEGSSGRVLLSYKMKDVVITGWQFSALPSGDEDGHGTDVGSTQGSVGPVSSAGGGEDRPMESLSLNYGAIEMVYTGVQQDGTEAAPVRAAWDLKLNKAV